MSIFEILTTNNIVLQITIAAKIIDLVYGLMLQSGNDAAEAIARYLGGSIEGFANISDRATIKGKITIGGRVRVDGNAHIILHESYGIIDQAHHSLKL